ncbi:MAG: ATP-binding protein, partial [candidate division Zixibacteria bacterium]|nr:ATP-binding protein [candidate division Zixibacteria bacterium]
MQDKLTEILENQSNQEDYSLGELLIKTSSDSSSSFVNNSPKQNNNIQTNVTVQSNCMSGRNYNLLKESILQQFNFNKKELMIIATLFSHYFHNEISFPVPVNQLLKTIFGKNSNSLTYIQDLVTLAKDGIVSITNNKNPMRLPYTLSMLFDLVNIEEEILCDHVVYLSKPFINFIIDEQPPVLSEDAYSTNLEFFQDTNYCCKLAYRYGIKPEIIRRINSFDVTANIYFENIWKRLNITSIDVPFISISNKYNLNMHEQLVLWHLIDIEKRGQKSTTAIISGLIEDNSYTRNKIKSILSEEGKLIRNGLIEVNTEMILGIERSLISINPAVYEYIVDSKALNASPLSITKLNSAIQLLTPKKSSRDLILSNSEGKMLNSIIRTSLSDSNQFLSEWDLIGSDDNYEQTIILLHGCPGTGKTLSAEVIASELKKDLMVIDISQIKDKWIGNSEKNLKKIFNTYYEYFERTENPPILLLNECDQFLSKRIENVSHHADQMMNTMQNMLLEFFENFKGICIATTNMVSNLDPAFSRRFTQKIKLSKPLFEERKKLWNLFIPEKLPLASDVNIDELANKYSFSGSQIKTVILNAATDVASRNE